MLSMPPDSNCLMAGGGKWWWRVELVVLKWLSQARRGECPVEVKRWWWWKWPQAADKWWRAATASKLTARLGRKWQMAA